MLSMVYFHCKTIRNAANITANFEKSPAKSVILEKNSEKSPAKSCRHDKCLLAVCVHIYPIMIKIHPVVFNLIPTNNILLCDITQTKAASTIVDWH